MLTSKEVISLREGEREWLVSTDGRGDVRITECAGPFLLPQREIKVTWTMAKALAKAISDKARQAKVSAA